MGLLTAAAAVIGTVAAGSMASKAQSKAAKQATNAQVQAADEALNFERETYYDQRNLLEPSIAAGAEANARRMLMQGIPPAQVRAFLDQQHTAINGDGGGPATPYDSSWVDSYNWQSSSPSYAFRMQQGQDALERSKAARGDLFSGSTGQALTEYGQNFASQEFDADWRRFGELAGEGTDATGTTVNVTGQYGDAAAGLAQDKGAARASGYQQRGEANASMWGNVASGIGAAYGLGRKSGWFGK